MYFGKLELLATTDSIWYTNSVYSTTWLQQRAVGIQRSVRTTENQMGKSDSLSRQNIWYEKWKLIAKFQTRNNFLFPEKFRDDILGKR